MASAVENIIGLFGETPAEKRKRKSQESLLAQEGKLNLDRDAAQSQQRINEDTTSRNVASEQAMRLRDSDLNTQNLEKAKADATFKEALANKFINEGRYGVMDENMRKMFAMGDAQAEMEDIKTAVPLSAMSSARNAYERDLGSRPVMGRLGQSTALADVAEADARGSRADVLSAIDKRIQWSAPYAAEAKLQRQMYEDTLAGKGARERIPFVNEVIDTEMLQNKLAGEKASGDILLEQLRTEADISDEADARREAVKADKAISIAMATFPMLSKQLGTDPGITSPEMGVPFDPEYYRLNVPPYNPSSAIRKRAPGSVKPAGNINDLLKAFERREATGR